MERYTDKELMDILKHGNGARDAKLEALAYACLAEVLALRFPNVARTIEYHITDLECVGQGHEHASIVGNPDLAEALDLFLDNEAGYIMASALHGTIIAWKEAHE